MAIPERRYEWYPIGWFSPNYCTPYSYKAVQLGCYVCGDKCILLHKKHHPLTIQIQVQISYRVLWNDVPIETENPITVTRQSLPPYSPLGKPRAWNLVPYADMARLLWPPLICRNPPTTNNHPQSPHFQSISQNSRLRFPKTGYFGNGWWWSMEGGGEGKCGGRWC